VVYRCINSFGRDRTLFGSSLNTGTQITTIKRHATAIAFDDSRQIKLCTFIGSESFVTNSALTATTNLIAITMQS
jgi:hypothetical protein